jgi:hypothetical protein
VFGQSPQGKQRIGYSHEGRKRTDHITQLLHGLRRNSGRTLCSQTRQRRLVHPRISQEGLETAQSSHIPVFARKQRERVRKRLPAQSMSSPNFERLGPRRFPWSSGQSARRHRVSYRYPWNVKLVFACRSAIGEVQLLRACGT